MGCDLIARTVFAPAELGISTVTAVFGAPVVLWVMAEPPRFWHTPPPAHKPLWALPKRKPLPQPWTRPPPSPAHAPRPFPKNCLAVALVMVEVLGRSMTISSGVLIGAAFGGALVSMGVVLLPKASQTPPKESKRWEGLWHCRGIFCRRFFTIP